MWVLWIALVTGFVWNIWDKHLYWVKAGDFSVRPNFFVLALVAAGQTVMVLVMRWIFFRFMMQNVDPAGLRGAVWSIVGVVVVYGMIKATETAGLRLWSASGWMAHYYCFALTGFILAVLLLPGNLRNYVLAGQKVRADCKWD